MHLRAMAPSGAQPLAAGRWAHPHHHVGACRHRSVPLRPLLPRSLGPTPHQQRPQRQFVQSLKAAAPEAAAPEAPLPAPAVAHKAALRLAVETLRPDWLLLAGTMVALAATIFFTLLFPLLIGEVFDFVRAQGGLAGKAAGAAAINPFAAAGVAATPTSFTAVLLKLGSCLVLSATGNALVAWCSALLGERFGYRLRGRLMETLLRRDQAFYDASTTGDLVSRLTLDVTVLQTTLADFIGQRGFRSMFEVVGALLMIAVQQPLLALVSCAITPLLSRLLRAVVVRSSAIIYQRQTLAAEALEYAAERLSQVQTVQVFAQQEREAGAFAELSGSGYQLAQRYAFFQGVVEGAGRLAVNVGTVALLGFGGWLVIQGRISVGALLAVNVFNLFISIGLSSVAASLGELGKALGALERVSELVAASHPATQDVAATVSSGSAAGTSSSSSGSHSASAGAPGHSSNGHGSSSHVIAAGSSNGSSSSSSRGASGVELRDVWFKYPGAMNWAVQGINLTIDPGQTVALVGPSGGGKSTIAALLLGLYTPQRGTVLVDGKPLVPKTDGGSGAAEAGMAAVLQQPMLMSGSVRQQIRYGKPEASHDEVLAAARAAHADEFVSQLPDRYDTEVGERGHVLSGGQKQRLAIARALLLQPKILVLDEVTSALDVASERYISSTLRSMAATKLIIAHRLSTVRQADVIVAVADGRVVEQGTHHQLLALEGGTYRRLVKTAELGAFWAHAPASDTNGSHVTEGGSKQHAREAAASMLV